MSELSEPITGRMLGGLPVVSPKEYRRPLNLLIYGEAGVGKTVLAASSDDVPELRKVLILDVEGGTMSIDHRFPDVSVVRLTDFLKSDDIYDELWRKKDHGYGCIVLDSLSEMQKLCHAADTEVLTPKGWKLFSELTLNDEVAQYSRLTEEISFIKPTELQKFNYNGEMVRVGNRTSGLLVTPNHRMLVGGPYYKNKYVTDAANLHAVHHIPKGALLQTEQELLISPTPDQARLLVAFQADGFFDNYQYSSTTSAYEWEFRKERKQDRLRKLLASVGANYYEREKSGRFHVYRDSVPFIQKFMPNKRWEWKHVFWNEEARRAVLDEVSYWDGNSTTNSNHLIYFTAQKHNADVIAAMCSVTARTSYTVQCDDGTYRVQSVDRSWRSVNSILRVPYTGYVYCATVPTGFLVTRREGKVDISGNSMNSIMEGELYRNPETDPDVPSIRNWGKNSNQIRRLVRRFRDLPIPTIFTALVSEEKDERTGRLLRKPALSGKLASEVAGFFDIVGYLYIREIQGQQTRFMLTSGAEGVVAKDRSEQLPPILESPTMKTVFELVAKGNTS